MKISLNIATIMLAALFIGACTPESREDPGAAAMDSTAMDSAAMDAAAEAEVQMQATIDTVIQAWDTGNTDLLDAVAAPDLERTAPDRNTTNLAEYKNLIAEAHRAYPDFSITSDAAAVGPEGGFVQWTVTGTDSGGDGATGNSMKATGITRYEIENGKIARELVVFDTGAVLNQLQREDMPHVAQ